MACFLVPAAEAVVVAAAAFAVKKHEEHQHITVGVPNSTEAEEKSTPFSRKLMWLFQMLAGGAFLLAFEHVWHGEVVPWFPFLTAAYSPESTAVMLHEMATVGVLMAVLVTAVWGGMVAVSDRLTRRGPRTETEHA